MDFSLRLSVGSEKFCHWIQAQPKQYIGWGDKITHTMKCHSPFSFVQLPILLRYHVYFQRKQGEAEHSATMLASCKALSPVVLFTIYLNHPKHCAHKPVSSASASCQAPNTLLRTTLITSKQSMSYRVPQELTKYIRGRWKVASKAGKQNWSMGVIICMI
jgi:hypothetical protein